MKITIDVDSIVWKLKLFSPDETLSMDDWIIWHVSALKMKNFLHFVSFSLERKIAASEMLLDVFTDETDEKKKLEEIFILDSENLNKLIRMILRDTIRLYYIWHILILSIFSQIYFLNIYFYLKN